MNRPFLPTSMASKMTRRHFLTASAAGLVFASAASAQAQTYPTRPITMIVPFPAGGPTDIAGRVLAERMRLSLGQPIIIEHVSGAEGSVGTSRAAHARPDGFTIELGIRGTHVLNGAFYSLPYDVWNDFAPISPLVVAPTVLFAKKTMPANDLRELIAWLKANPNKALAGNFTAGGRLLMARFQKETGTRFALVPYRGSAPAMQDLVTGQIDMLLDGLVHLQLVRAGSIKAYVVGSKMRLALAPDIPTGGETGLPVLSNFSTWFGLFGPKGTPKDIIDKLNAAAVEALADPAVRSRLVDFGMEIFPREKQTPEALGKLVQAHAH